MGPRLILWSVLGVAAGFALQAAQAREPKPAVSQGHPLGAAAVHRVAFVAPARSNLRADIPKMTLHDATSRRAEPSRDYSFSPVTPLKAEHGEDGGLRIENGGRRTGPSTSPRERKSITFIRLNPKLGDVSVQPVVGGVNGAQVSVGF